MLVVYINSSPFSITSTNQMATEVLNAEARGEGFISPFGLGNAIKRLDITLGTTYHYHPSLTKGQFWTQAR